MFKGSQSQNWLPLGNGVGGSINRLYTDTVTNLLYVTGIFSANSDNIFGGVAKWNGTQWDTLPNCQAFPTKSSVFKYLDTLFVSGVFNHNSYISKWNGNIFDTIPGTRDMNIYCTAEHNGILYLGGDFRKCGSDSAFSLCSYDGHIYTAITPHYKDIASVFTLAFYKDTLYVGGVFNLYPESPIASFAKWNGADLVAVSSEFANVNCSVFAMAVYKDELYIGGHFTKASGFIGDYIMKWDGLQFTEVGGGTDQRVTSMKVYNNELYVGGWFTRVGSIDCDNIAKWDGTQWTCLNHDAFDSFYSIWDLCVLNDRLYIGGNFDKIGNDSIHNIAMYNHPLTSVTENNKENSQLIVYPNPVTSNEFTISFPFITSGTLQVVNLLGEVIMTHNISNAAKININAEALSKGCYIIKVQSDNKCFAEKFIKQ
jgi:hypothetical protein